MLKTITNVKQIYQNVIDKNLKIYKCATIDLLKVNYA